MKHHLPKKNPIQESSENDYWSAKRYIHWGMPRTQYAKKWILPRWGSLSLQRIKTVDVERWLREAAVANGTKAKLKCLMSALFSHAAVAQSDSVDRKRS